MQPSVIERPRATAQSTVLEVRDLRVYYHTPRGAAKAVDGVSFDLHAGERVGLVGESGSGKTTIALALMRMIRPPGRIEGGTARLDGVNLFSLSDEQMRRLRLASIAMVAQGAMSSLNPVIRIRDQIVDALKDHGLRLSKSELQDGIATLLQRVGLGPHVANMYPHELSGGMKQRVCIAIAISMSPKVIIADEPVSMVDASLRATILGSLRELNEAFGISLLYITHDLTTAYQVSRNIVVLYRGTVAEVGDVEHVVKDPQHPYTRLLVGSIPQADPGHPWLPEEAPSEIGRRGDGSRGCRFAPRCPAAMEICVETPPPLYQTNEYRAASCYLHRDAPPLPRDEMDRVLAPPDLIVGRA